MMAHHLAALSSLTMRPQADAYNASGINVGTPLVLGDVSRFVSCQETGRTDLSSKQLQGLASWLENHRSGWHGMITEAAATNYASLSLNGCKYVASSLSSPTVDAASNAAPK